MTRFKKVKGGIGGENHKDKMNKGINQPINQPTMIRNDPIQNDTKTNKCERK